MSAASESPEQVQRWWFEQVAKLGAVAMGSLSLRRSPCIRAQCSACQSGEQHPSYVLYGRQGKKRFGIYIPDELVPQIRQALENGSKLQTLLQESTRRYVQALKRERKQRRG